MHTHRFVMIVFLAMSSLNSVAQTNSPTQTGKFVTFREALRDRHVELSKSSLVEALRNPDSQVRYLAALTLAEDKATDTVPAIIEALESEKQPEARVNIALALAELGEPRGLAALKSTCDNRSAPAYIRLYATKYMLDVGNEHCLGAIFDVLQSKSALNTRALALSMLPRFRHVSEADSQRISAATIGALADPMPDVRIAASEALPNFAPTSAIPALQEAIAKETEDAVRSRMQIDLQRLQKLREEKP